MRIFIFSIVLLLTLVATGSVFGQKLCIKEHSADLLSSPSRSGSVVVLQIPKYYPLDVLGENGDFFRVRDFLGRNGWVEKALVQPQISIVVISSIANVRSGAGKDHEILFKARRGVTFRVLENRHGWLHVEHESGKTGWLFENLVWGLPKNA
jgi:SH3-like domain-containing protein